MSEQSTHILSSEWVTTWREGFGEERVYTHVCPICKYFYKDECCMTYIPETKTILTVNAIFMQKSEKKSPGMKSRPVFMKKYRNLKQR